MNERKRNMNNNTVIGAVLLGTFVVWTLLIQWVDVKPVGVNGTNIGFASLNVWFHELTGVHMSIYTITDWLGVLPIIICMIFGCIGLVQLIRRKSLLKVDSDILILGIYYILVIGAYGFFEMVPINYRPILIDGFMEASYPSSTTLLVLSVMPTLKFQADRRLAGRTVRKIISVFVIFFSVFMIGGRTISGVHWITDINGSILFCTGLYLLYKGVIEIIDEKKAERDAAI